MRALLRAHAGKYYVWKDVTWDGGKYISDGRIIPQINILAVQTNGEENQVICTNCGTLIPNNPESIEAHFAEMEKKRDCLNCKAVREFNRKEITVKYTKQNDGTYKANADYVTKLQCGNAYANIDNLAEREILTYCQYHKCRRFGVRELNDVLITKPGLFETQITVDVLNAKKYQYAEYRNGYFHYDLKCRGTLRACVNELGIVDHFELKYRYNIFNLYYSKKYNKLFCVSNGQYSENIPWGVSDSKWDQVKTRIASLY